MPKTCNSNSKVLKMEWRILVWRREMSNRVARTGMRLIKVSLMMEETGKMGMNIPMMNMVVSSL